MQGEELEEKDDDERHESLDMKGSKVGRIKESIKDTRGEKGEHNHEQIEERSLFFFLSLLLSHTFLSFSVSVSLSHTLSHFFFFIIYILLSFFVLLYLSNLNIYP